MKHAIALLKDHLVIIQNVEFTGKEEAIKETEQAISLIEAHLKMRDCGPMPGDGNAALWDLEHSLSVHQDKAKAYAGYPKGEYHARCIREIEEAINVLKEHQEKPNYSKLVHNLEREHMGCTRCITNYCILGQREEAEGLKARQKEIEEQLRRIDPNWTDPSGGTGFPSMEWLERSQKVEMVHPLFGVKEPESSSKSVILDRLEWEHSECTRKIANEMVMRNYPMARTLAAHQLVVESRIKEINPEWKGQSIILEIPPEKTSGLSFAEALEAFKNGKKLERKDAIFGGVKQMDQSLVLTFADMIATDWRIVE